MTDAGRLQRTTVDRLVGFVLLLMWGAVVVLIDPRAEVALNDDWAYALPVEMLVDHGRLEVTFWQSMPLLPQVLWGGLFCLPGGFSFTAVRLSVVVLGAVGLWLTHSLLCRRGEASLAAAAGAACLLACPLYVALGHSFMTDVPFVALCLASVLAFSRALESPVGSACLGLAVALSVVATLVRQSGVALPLAHGVVLLLHRRWNVGILWRAAWPVMVVGGVLPLHRWFLEQTSGIPGLYDFRNEGLLRAVGDLVHLNLGVLVLPTKRAFETLLYLGLMLLPWLMVRSGGVGRGTARRDQIGFWLGISIAAGLLLIGVKFPVEDHGNILSAGGIGPVTIPGLVPGGAWPWLRFSFVALAGLGAGLLVAQLLNRLVGVFRTWRTAPDLTGAFCVIVVAVGVGPMLLAYGPYFDRHALFVMPLAMVLLAGGESAARPRRSWLAAAAVVLLGCLVFSVAATHDYLACQRAAWDLARSHPQPNDLAAGFEYDNYVDQRAILMADIPNPGVLADRSGAQHAVAFQPPAGAHVLTSRAVDAWLPWGPRELFLFRRPR